jgi:hypothetical protein
VPNGLVLTIPVEIKVVEAISSYIFCILGHVSVLESATDKLAAVAADI